MELTVFIPTRGRVGSSKQITLREIQTIAQGVKPVIVCPVDEVARHNYYHKHGETWGVDAQGIGPVRQWILEHSPTRGVVMLDDDMYFSYRRTPDFPELNRATDLLPLFEWISTQLDNGFAHGGISARQGNNNIGFGSTDCIRVNNAHFFDRDVFLGEGLKFDTLPVMEDFYITLTMLLRGYPNRVAYHYCWNQRGSGAQGGCSLYRTPELQARAAHMLHEQFPNYVKVVEKNSASQHGAMAKRTDVNIQWLKAWDARMPVTRQFLGYVPATPDVRRR